jgi:hypothetical protein
VAWHRVPVARLSHATAAANSLDRAAVSSPIDA